MYPRLIHLYGPVWIASYGTMIALSFLIFFLCTINHSLRKKYISADQYQELLFVSLLAGILGGRVLGVISEWEMFSENWVEIFYPWVGGFMVLGSIISIIIVAPWYLYRHNIAILPLLDLGALFGPLMQAIARFGCLFAGCCYGMPAPSDAWFAVLFTDPAGAAPLHVMLYPTQLYASLLSFIIFVIMQLMYRASWLRYGQLVCSYLTLESCARLIIDFWRDDRHQLFTLSYFPGYQVALSQAQLLSGVAAVLGLLALALVSSYEQRASYTNDANDHI